MHVEIYFQDVTLFTGLALAVFEELTFVVFVAQLAARLGIQFYRFLCL
jgi:hypothetical protein